MADIHTAPTVERFDHKAAAHPDMKADPLFAEWVSLHQNSQARDKDDNKACADAKRQDEDSIIGRNAGSLSKAEKVRGDREDLRGDFQAIGKHKGEHGDDQNNRDADMKIVVVDREMLARYGSHMTAEQKQAINEDIAAKLRTAHNSNADIANENAFIKGDKTEMAALRAGTTEQIEAANQQQINLRKLDAKAEEGYINDNNASINADAKVLKLFGAVQVTGG